MKLKLLIALLFVQFGFSQQRTCGMEQNMERIMNDPIARQNYLNLQAKFEIELAKLEKNPNSLASTNATIIIPVAVHFPDATTPTACLRALAQTQIDILNLDYNGLNLDISQWSGASSSYPGVNTGNMDVRFVLANRNHPAGSNLVDGDLAVTFGTNFLGGADSDGNWSGYMNLVCRNAGQNLLGYSPLGGSPTNGQTVVIALNAFGKGAGCPGYVPRAPYNLGRTLTHELGHFFNLNHTFSSSCTNSNCNTQGDRVCDTPPSNAPTYGCPATGSVSQCNGENALTVNFMDYTNDACMYMFTAGQATRMLAYYNTISSQFSTNVLSTNEFFTNNFSIVPNPSKGIFDIQLKSVLNDYTIVIYDTTGRVIFEREYVNNSELNQLVTLNDTMKGVYLISIRSQGDYLTKKIIIE
jgi:hypothetical protein